MKYVKRLLKKWFVTRPALRFALTVAGVFFGHFEPELFWPGVAVLAAGALLHLWAKGCLRQYVALTTGGPYRFVRHPFYLSYLVIDIGICLMIADLRVAAAYFPVWFTIYYFQIKREELGLLKLFGKRYALYRGRVPALIPLGRLAPRTGGQAFWWKNPNFTRRSEIPRLLRLAIFPLFFFLAYRVRDAGLDYFSRAGKADAFAVSALLAVFFFARLLNPAIKRRGRMLPRRLESRTSLAIVQVAVIGVAVFAGTPHACGAWPLWTAAGIAAGALASVFIRPLAKLHLPLILGSAAIAVAWQSYYLVPVAAFYYAACTIDHLFFPHHRGRGKHGDKNKSKNTL